MTIMVGIDMHVKTLVCLIGYQLEKPQSITFKNDHEGRLELISLIEDYVKSQKADDVLVCYEASGLGYLLYDLLWDEGYRCEILAPTEMLKSPKGYKKKTDKKDARYIYQIIRGHVLAGNDLHNTWVPDKRLRLERDVVRTRFDISQKITRIKVQIQTFLKKNGIVKPDNFDRWTKVFIEWLQYLMNQNGLAFRISLETLVNQLLFLEEEGKKVDKVIRKIMNTERYAAAASALMAIPGVGMKTAMTFLTELGDMSRFSNRRQLGAYLGIVPSTFESGEVDNRKGRITRDGPYRVRAVLNQAVWAHLRSNGEERAVYDRIAEKNPGRKKKAVVACMRRMAVRMWHVAKNVSDEDPLKQAS